MTKCEHFKKSVKGRDGDVYCAKRCTFLREYILIQHVDECRDCHYNEPIPERIDDG